MGALGDLGKLRLPARGDPIALRLADGGKRRINRLPKVTGHLGHIGWAALAALHLDRAHANALNLRQPRSH